MMIMPQLSGDGKEEKFANREDDFLPFSHFFISDYITTSLPILRKKGSDIATGEKVLANNFYMISHYMRVCICERIVVVRGEDVDITPNQHLKYENGVLLKFFHG